MYIFKKIPNDEIDTLTITYEEESHCINDLLKTFEDFLKGCGFTVNGEITLVEQDD